MRQSKTIPFLICILSVALVISATDIYLPGFPLLVDHFETSGDRVQMTVGVYMFVLAVMSLVFGPLVDVFGRRPILLIGYILFVVGGLLCGFSRNIEALIIARAFQGLGASAVSVIVLVVIQDLYGREEAAKKFAQAGMVIVFAPVIGQILGGYLIEYLGWSSCFFFMAVLGGMLWGASYGLLPETRGAETKAPQSFAQVLKNYHYVFTHRRAMAVFLTMPLLFCGFWIFRTITPLLFIAHKGVPVTHYGYYMMGIFAANFMGGWYTQKVVKKMGMDSVIQQGLFLALLSAVLLIGAAMLGWDRPLVLIFCMFPYAASISLTISTSFSKGAAYFTGIGGATSATFTSLRMGAAALGGFLGGVLDDDSVYELGFALLGCAVIASGMVFYVLKKEKIGKKSFFEQ